MNTSSNLSFLFHFIRGTKTLLSHRELWPFMIYPVLAGIFVFLIVLFAGIVVVSGGLISSFIDPSLSTFAVIVSAIILVALTTLFFFSIINLILCLFNAKLSKRLLILYGLSTPNKELELRHVLKIEILKMFIIFPILIFAWVLSVALPGIGIFLGLCLTGFALTFQYIDFSHEVLLKSFQERTGFAKKNWISYILIGVVIAPLLSIPFLNFFAIPWSIAVTSSLVAEAEKKTLF